MKSKCKSQAESAHDRFVLRTESYPFLSFLTVERVAESSSLIRELDLADNGVIPAYGSSVPYSTAC